MENVSLTLAEPILTANVYCAGFLDQLIHEAIAPFWARYSASAGDGGRFLWFARYGRGGEHLKIRFHGSAAERDEVRQELATAVERFLGALPGLAAASERDGLVDQFPIDPEDHCARAYPDRTLLWTTYRCEPGIMGRQPMSADRLHAALFTGCLGIGTDIVLAGFKPDATGTVPGSLRLSLALKFFVAAFCALDLPPRARVENLRYHRDWLLASFGLEIAPACARIDQQIESRPALLAGLRPLLETAAQEEDALVDEGDLYYRWQSRFAELLCHAIRRANDPAFLADPYLRDQVLATSFKLLHAHTNQLATGLWNEAYVCQLLIRACEAIWQDAAPAWRS